MNATVNAGKDEERRKRKLRNYFVFSSSVAQVVWMYLLSRYMRYWRVCSKQLCLIHHSLFDRVECTAIFTPLSLYSSSKEFRIPSFSVMYRSPSCS